MAGFKGMMSITKENHSLVVLLFGAFWQTKYLFEQI